MFRNTPVLIFNPIPFPGFTLFFLVFPLLHQTLFSAPRFVYIPAAATSTAGKQLSIKFVTITSSRFPLCCSNHQQKNITKQTIHKNTSVLLDESKQCRRRFLSPAVLTFLCLQSNATTVKHDFLLANAIFRLPTTFQH